MMYANGGAPVGEVDFDPVSYRQGMISSKHIENPGDTGETYVLGYTRTPDGDVVVKQMNRVVNKAGALGTIFGQSDELTGVSPESDKWNLVLNSANTKKELSTIESYKSGSPVETPPKSVATDPKAKIAYAHNQSYQTFKNHWLDEGLDLDRAEHAGAAAASVGAKLGEEGSYLPNSEKGYKELENVNVATPKKREAAATAKKPRGVIEILMDAISGLAGFGSKDEKGGGDKLTANKESQSTPPGAKNPSVYPKQGKTLYLHWTAGGYNSVVGPYHTVFTGDGKKHRLVDYDRTSGHTEGRNSNSIGLSLASMGGGSNENNMAQAPTEAQIDAMATEAATIGKGMGWTTGDINIRNVMTHGEAGSNLDGRNATDNYGPSVWGGTGERWDLDKLRSGQKIGDGGPEMRSRIAAKLGTVSAPVKAQTGGQMELGKSKPVIPEIPPLQKTKPKVTMIDGGTSNTSGAKRQVTATQIPHINASTASREKANLLGIIDY
jgi:hypothetical protein